MNTSFTGILKILAKKKNENHKTPRKSTMKHVSTNAWFRIMKYFTKMIKDSYYSQNRNYYNFKEYQFSLKVDVCVTKNA